jgi:hypothetical protein
MTTQNHIIKKQVLDLTIDSEVGSFIFQSRASEVFKTKIVPLIEDHCSRISGDSGTIRIDRLEIDLGVISRNNFESDFKSKFDKLFPGQLAKALRISPGENSLPGFGDEATSGKPDVITDEVRDFEILEFFIREGRLPWWVRVNESHNIPALLTRSITSQPVKAKNLIIGIVGNPSLVKRLVYHVEKSVLEKILGFFQPAHAGEIYNLSQDLITKLNGCPLVQSVGPSKIRPELLSCVLTWSVASEGQAFKQQHLVETIIKHLANSFDLDFNALYDYLAKDFKMKGKVISNKPDTSKIAGKLLNIAGFKAEEYFQYLVSLENLLKELQTELMACKKVADSTFSTRWLLDGLVKKITHGMKSIQHIRNMLEQFRQKVTKNSIFPAMPPGTDADLRKQAEKFEKRLEKLRFDLVALLHRDIRKTHEQIQPKVPITSIFPTTSSGRTDAVFLKKQAEKFEKWLEKLHLDVVALLHRDLSKMNFEMVKKVESMVKTMDGLGKEAASQERLTVKDAISDSEEIFVGNAGIVLLWPYLAKFFDAIGIIKEERFIDEEAAGRAALFIHYLASGTLVAQEYELVLNKILCGIESNHPVNPNLEMNKKEAAECENLLQAVIGNWAALKNVSVPGFRKMFLQREGMIFTRDGQRVLRAAGESYDILLDKMPWGISTVKLPWMEQILIVEWRV